MSMQEVTPALLDATYTGFQAVVQNAMERTDVWYTGVATTIPSTSREEVLSFMERTPVMREWKGPRIAHSLAAQAFRAKNKKFELTVKISRDDLEDSKIALYAAAVSDFGESLKKWPDQQMAGAMQAGKTVKCFDGKFFYAADHFVAKAKGTGSQKNLYTVTPLTFDNYVKVKQERRALLGPDGQPLSNWTKRQLVVPPQLEDIAMSIVKTDKIVRSATVGAVDNTEKNTADILVVPELSNEPDVWYMNDVGGYLKPFVWLDRYKPDFVPLFNPSDPNVFNLDEFIFGSRARGVATYGAWWKSCRVEST